MSFPIGQTAKQRVLKKYPGAYAKEGLMSGDWYIYRKSGSEYVAIAKAETAKLAWKQAADSL